MARLLATLLLPLALLAGLPLHAQDSAAALWQQDLRLAQVAERIGAANVPLCRETMPLTGLILHSADQYSKTPTSWFANGEVAAAQVLPGSVADRAGIRSGDGLLAIAGLAVNDLALAANYPLRDAVFYELTRAPSPLLLVIRRDSVEEVVALAPPSGCRALVEVLSNGDRVARSDGRVVQISYGMAVLLDDAGLAAVYAHELAHLILEHARRLHEAGVRGGLAQEFGRNRRLARQAEVEADRLSVHLLANAGFDPAVGPRLWETDTGRILYRSLLRSRRYPSRADRVQLMQQEIAEHLAGGALPSAARHLLDLRDRPLADQPLGDPGSM